MQTFPAYDLLVAYLLGLTLHEFMHGYVAFTLGDNTAAEQGRLSLNPMAHIDSINTLLLPILLFLAHSPIIFGAAKPVPFNPWSLRYGKWGAALVAISGPATNFVVAIFFGLWIRFIMVPDFILNLFASIVMINLALGLFNLIPIPPLDGSRVLYAVAPYDLREVMDRIERAGFVTIMIIVIVVFLLFGNAISNAIYSLAHLIDPKYFM